MVCRLCGHDLPLVKAHIIPESFWPLNFDSRGPMALLGNSSGRAVPSRKGPFDNGILCGKCDSEVLNRFDQHASKALLQSDPVHYLNSVDYFCYPNAEPDTLHGFATSVAWRASISSHEFFSRVKLHSYEGVCRSSFMGNQNDQAKLEIYLVEFDKRDVPITDPYHTHLGAAEFLVIQAAWFQFWMKIDDKPAPKELLGFALRKGMPVISVIRSWQDSKQRKGLKVHFKDEPRPRFWKQ